MKIINPAFLLVFLVPIAFTGSFALKPLSPGPDAVNQQTTEQYDAATIRHTGAVNILFKSADGGQTWQDISTELPATLPEDGFRDGGFVANGNGVYVRAADGIYHSQPGLNTPFRRIAGLPGKQSSLAPGNTGIFTYSWDNGSFNKLNGTNDWSQVYKSFPVKNISSVFETAGGTVFISCQYGLFRSTDDGKTWNKLKTKGWVSKVVESGGIMLATSQSGILRSTDDGVNWDRVLYEGGVGIDVQSIHGGFAAITYNTQSGTRRVRKSPDGGKTWEPIDASLRADALTSSIIQVGENFLCGHPDGIFKSSDNGQTWQLMKPAIGNKVFTLFVAGDVIYAIPRSGGC